MQSGQSGKAENPASQSTNLSKGTLIGGIIAGIAASTCCIGPLVLLTLGISGSWIGNLSALESVRPIFIGLTLLFLGLAFRKLYLTPQACAVDAPCARPSNLRKQRITFWVVSVFVLVVISFPWYGPYLLD
ncbi:MAG: mercuric transporter MerT family protein [Gammaproteobacteria bacterium]|nr:mercuric transporter MerT family protein [Gammaproteobacteria bacterium]